jgi:spore coat polysaccharide biosynthesis predicted glycosyltransferase SpsG
MVSFNIEERTRGCADTLTQSGSGHCRRKKKIAAFYRDITLVVQLAQG